MTVEEVMNIEDESVVIPLDMARPHPVAVKVSGWPPALVEVGSITTRRALFGFAIGELRDVHSMMADAKINDMPRLLELLAKKIQGTAECGNTILNDIGDTDPRHDAKLVKRRLSKAHATPVGKPCSIVHSRGKSVPSALCPECGVPLNQPAGRSKVPE